MTVSHSRLPEASDADAVTPPAIQLSGAETPDDGHRLIDISAITEQTSKVEALMVSNNQLLSRMSSRMDAQEKEIKERRSGRGKRRDILSDDEDSD